MNQGDDGFHAEGGEWESQSSGGRNDDEVMMAALDGAKQYVQPVLPVTSVRVKRDPKKNATAKRNRRKCRVEIVLSHVSLQLC